jgi:DNA repair exonuclease SbcCD ATPase subunit
MDEQLNTQQTTATDNAQASATPAEAQNTETTSAGEPGPVPYSRFKAINEETKSLKAQLADLQKALKANERASMSEVERLKAEKAELEAAANQAREAITQMRLKDAFRSAAATKKVRFVDGAMDDAFKLADLTGVQVEESGAVRGMEAAIDALLKAKPYLVQRPEPAQIDASAGTGAGKPASSGPEVTKQKIEELRQRYRIP